MRKTYLENWICEVEGMSELTRGALEALQLRRLNETLSRLKARGGFYRDLPDSLEDLSQLKELPFTTPEMLSANPGKFLLTSQSEVSRIISGATSGTTGPAKRVFYTNRDTAHTIGFFAAGISEMLNPGEKCLIAFPFTGAFGLGDLIAQGVERLGGIPVKAGFAQSWGELCEIVRKKQPETYIGFPASLLGLIRMYPESLPIKRALVSGDACPEGVMAELENALGSKLYPHYGSREMCLGGAVTCPAFEGMHLRENHVIAEIIDEQGNSLPDGQWGELVITTIDMEAMPLIRYRTGDYTRFLSSRCPCGGITRRLDRVSRRGEHPINMEDLDSVLFPIPELVDYCAYWDGSLKIDAHILDNSAEDAIRSVLSERYPGIHLCLSSPIARMADEPMYHGKRYVIT